MDLFDRDEVFEEKKRKLKKKSMIIIISIVIVFILMIIIGALIMYYQSMQFGMTVNGVPVAVTKDMVLTNEETGKPEYVSIQAIAPLLQDTDSQTPLYTYSKGKYGENSESDDAGYLKGENEIIQFEMSKKRIEKIDPRVTTTSSSSTGGSATSTTSTYKYMDLNNNIKYKNGKLYASIDDLRPIINSRVIYNSQTNKLSIETLGYLQEYYRSNLIPKVTSQGYTDLDTNFSNLKALDQNMIVVKTNQGNVGVITPDGQVKISPKYTTMEFSETTNEFIVKADSKVGIISVNGSQKVSMNYTSIELVDKDLSLYLVRQNDKYGVISIKSGGEKNVVPVDYTQVGVSKNDFPSLASENNVLFYNKVIPVKRDDKWGLYNIEGNQVVPIQYDYMGCQYSSTQGNKKNAILLDKYEGIIIGKKEGESSSNKKYNVYNPQGQELIPGGFVLDNIYYTEEAGVKTYFLEYGGQTGEVDKVFAANGIKQVDTGSTSLPNINMEDNTNKDVVKTDGE